MSDDTDKTAGAPAEGEANEKAENAEQATAAVEQSEDAADQADDAGAKDDGKAGEGEDGERKSKKPSGSQRAKRREEFLLTELRERERQIEELRRQSPAGDGGQEDQPPKEEDFNGDWTAFVAAKAAYEAAQAVGKKLDAREKSDTERRQADAVREREIAHLERIDEAREVISDFDQVMAGMKGVYVRDDVIEEIKHSDKSHLISYHLAQNPNKLRDLNSMSGRELAKEIGRLEATLKMPEAKRQTGAPPPPRSVKGGTAASFDPAKAEMAEYAANFAKRKAAQGR